MNHLVDIAEVLPVEDIEDPILVLLEVCAHLVPHNVEHAVALISLIALLLVSHGRLTFVEHMLPGSGVVYLDKLTPLVQVLLLMESERLTFLLNTLRDQGHHFLD